MHLQFSTAGQIHFGEGILLEVLPTMVRPGSRIMVVLGKQGAGATKVAEFLQSIGASTTRFVVSGEPDLATVSAGTALARDIQAEVILAVGGGSVMDTGKAISGLMNNPGEVMDYLEVVGAGKPLLQSGPPVIAIPTTAGTGAEVTRNAVIELPDRKVKVSLRAGHLLPRVAIVDPELTYSLPPDVTAYSGMDALAQLIEPFVSMRSNPLTDLFCRDGMVRAGRWLPAAYRDGADRDARREMSYASLLGGLALANSGLGAVHGFAGVIGGMYRASHGAICARLLGPVSLANYMAIQEKFLGSPSLTKYREIAELVTGKNWASVQELVEWIDNLCSNLQIPRLRDLGVRLEDLEPIVQRAAVASSMKANPIELGRDELLGILHAAW